MEREQVTASLRAALISLYGAVAAVVRSDEIAMDLMSADLRAALDGVDEVLIIVALATLKCLEDAVDDNDRHPMTSDSAAREMLSIASRLSTSTSPALVNSAAWRLDALRRGDHVAAADDLARSKRLGTEAELIHGSIALLAAVVTRRALHCGRSPHSLASELCLAAAHTP
jgi:hypothetical protein